VGPSLKTRRREPDARNVFPRADADSAKHSCFLTLKAPPGGKRRAPLETCATEPRREERTRCRARLRARPMKNKLIAEKKSAPHHKPLPPLRGVSHQGSRHGAFPTTPPQRSLTPLRRGAWGPPQHCRTRPTAGSWPIDAGGPFREPGARERRRVRRGCSRRGGAGVDRWAEHVTPAFPVPGGAKPAGARGGRKGGG